MSISIEAVRLVDDGEGWTLYWTEVKDDGLKPTPQRKGQWRKLYGNNTVEEAIEDTLAYFGGLVKREEITL